MLRDYQARDIAELRPLVASHASVLHQLPTGAGKTAEISEIVSLICTLNPGFVVWFVVPRNELLQQASDHFARWQIAHGHIKAGREESRAFKVQIVSKDTLLRRLHRIKAWPDVLIFDEAHLYYDAQLLIIEWARQARPALKMIGITATPERLDGRGLSRKAGGPYEAIHFGPSIPWLTDRGFLAPLRYFAPPIVGLDSIHRRGTEYDSDELDAFLEKRKVYGDVIRYYQKYGEIKQTGVSLRGLPTAIHNLSYHKGRPALIFCRSVKSAYETAERFTSAGYLFFCIEGRMQAGKRKMLIDALRKGEIDGLTNCDLATYGLDIPRVEYGASIRPTLSRALYFQMVGRILRPFQRKEEALFFDHANLVEEHQEPDSPGIPLFFRENLTWNFDGRERRERAPVEASVRLCPAKDYQYCADPACSRACKMLPQSESGRLALETVDVALQERKPPAHWAELAPGERREVQERIGRATDAWMSAQAETPPRIDAGAVGELLAVAKELGRREMWVYHFLADRDTKDGVPRLAINHTLLHEIARQKGYKRGWAWWKAKELAEQMEKAPA